MGDGDEKRGRRAGHRRRVAAGLVLVAVALALGLAVSRLRPGKGPPFSADRVPLLGPSAATLVPGVHYLGGLRPSVAYAVETREGLVLVDSGLEADAGPLKAELSKLGLGGLRVCAVLLTHAHGDHTGGAGYFRKASGAKVFAGRGDARVIRDGGPREAVFSTFAMPGEATHPTPVDVELGGGEVISVGGARFRAVATPGHTPGSVCYLMERDGLRALFSGDVVMMLLGDPRLAGEQKSPLGIYSAYLPPRYRGDARDYLASLLRLREVPAPDLLLPGHPGSDPTPQSPCLPPERWESMLDQGVADMKALLSRYERDGADFLDGRPKRLLPDLYYLGDAGGTAVYGLLASSRLFVVNAPVGPGAGGFVRSGLARLGLDPLPTTAVLLTSSGPESLTGLRDLVGGGRTQVVAPVGGVEAVKAACPPGTPVIPADALPATGWFPVTPLTLRGRGPATAAYHLRRAGKDVLFTGAVPARVNETTSEALLSDLRSGRVRVLEYLESLDRLHELKVNLWLPSTPADGQNANLYGGQWERFLAENVLTLRRYADATAPN